MQKVWRHRSVESFNSMDLYLQMSVQKWHRSGINAQFEGKICCFQIVLMCIRRSHACQLIVIAVCYPLFWGLVWIKGQNLRVTDMLHYGWLAAVYLDIYCRWIDCFCCKSGSKSVINQQVAVLVGRCLVVSLIVSPVAVEESLSQGLVPVWCQQAMSITSSSCILSRWWCNRPIKWLLQWCHLLPRWCNLWWLLLVLRLQEAPVRLIQWQICLVMTKDQASALTEAEADKATVAGRVIVRVSVVVVTVIKDHGEGVRTDAVGEIVRGRTRMIQQLLLTRDCLSRPCQVDTFHGTSHFCAVCPRCFGLQIISRSVKLIYIVIGAMVYN